MSRLHVTLASLVIALSAGCAHAPTALELIRFSDGAVATGAIDLRRRWIEVRLPDGEQFAGHFASVAERGSGDLSVGAFGHKPAWALTWPFDNKLLCYTVLTGDRGTVLELDFVHDGRSEGEGFGTARTNRGEEYKLITSSPGHR
jgi:hypothetical protein